MNKEQLLDLTERIKLVAGVEMPIIVGSQSLYAVTTFVPESVKQSIECDFLLLAVGPPIYRAVIEQIGFASSFQETHGYYADAVGLATVVLPTGWQERLLPLADEQGTLHAYCLEIHDTCVSKLMAGRDKDFLFIKEVLDRGMAEMGTFIKRIDSGHAPECRPAAASGETGRLLGERARFSRARPYREADPAASTLDQPVVIKLTSKTERSPVRAYCAAS